MYIKNYEYDDAFSDRHNFESNNDLNHTFNEHEVSYILNHTQIIGIFLGIIIGCIIWRVQIVCQRSNSLRVRPTTDRFTTLQESTPQDSMLQQSTIQNIEMQIV